MISAEYGYLLASDVTLDRKPLKSSASAGCPARLKRLGHRLPHVLLSCCLWPESDTPLIPSLHARQKLEARYRHGAQCPAK